MSTINNMNTNMVNRLNYLQKDISDSQERISTGIKLDKDLDMSEKRMVSNLTSKMMSLTQDTKLININKTNLSIQENVVKMSSEQLGSTNNSLLELSSGTTSTLEQSDLLNNIKENYRTWQSAQLTKGTDGTYVMHPMGNQHPMMEITNGVQDNTKKLENGSSVTFGFDYRDQIQEVNKDFLEMIETLETELSNGGIKTETASKFMEKFTDHEVDTFTARAEITSEMNHQKEVKDYNDIMFDVFNKDLSDIKSVNMEQEVTQLKMSQMQYEAVVKMLQTINDMFKSALAIG